MSRNLSTGRIIQKANNIGSIVTHPTSNNSQPLLKLSIATAFKIIKGTAMPHPIINTNIQLANLIKNSAIFILIRISVEHKGPGKPEPLLLTVLLPRPITPLYRAGQKEQLSFRRLLRVQ